MATEGLFEVALKLFVRRGDELLVLIASNTRKGDFPGGRMDPGDSLFEREASMRREIKEELGDQVQISVSRDPLFLFPYLSKEATQEVLGLGHVADFLGGEIQLSDEHIEYKWLPPAEALKEFDGHFLTGLQKYISLNTPILGENPIIIG